MVRLDEAKSVQEADEEIDQLEKDIERLCLKLLLQQQPVARDLRQISAALKMITDMERIGDQASDIAEIIISEKKDEAADIPVIVKMSEASSKDGSGQCECLCGKRPGVVTCCYRIR